MGMRKDYLKQANEGTWAQFKTHLDAAGKEVRAAVESLTKTPRP